MANKDTELIFEAYSKSLNENWEKGTSKAPKGKSFDMSRGGAPSNVDAARDGSGGRYRKTRPPSAPSKKTHGEMEEIPEEDDLGLGHGTPTMIKITSIGQTTPFKKKTEVPSENETVFIQAGQEDHDDECECHDDDEDKFEFNYDGEIDMARTELLKANDYAGKLFDMVANAEALPGWVASKITKASDYLSSVFHYLDYEMNAETVEDEEDETDSDEVEVDSLKGTGTAVNLGFAGAEQDDEDSVNEELMQKYHEEGKEKGLTGKKLENYVEDKMTQPGPHG